MKQIINTVMAGIIATVLGGIFLDWYRGGGTTGTKRGNIDVSVSWVEVFGKFNQLDQPKFKTVMPDLEKAIGVPGLLSFTHNMKYGTATIFSIRLANTDKSRAENIEIYVDGVTQTFVTRLERFALSGEFLGSSDGKPTKIAVINPGEIIEVTAIADHPIWPHEAVRVLSNGVRNSINVGRIAERESLGVVQYLLNNQPWGDFVAMMVVALGALLLLVIIISEWLTWHPSAWVKVIDRGTAARLVAMLTYLQEHRPELLPNKPKKEEGPPSN